jgi:O-antigen ligase
MMPLMGNSAPADGHRWHPLVRTLERLAGAALAATVFLAFATPSWSVGALALWPLATLRVANQVYRPGILLLVPLVGTAAAIAAQRLSGRLTPHLGPLAVLAPVGAYGALVLARIPPVHLADKAAVAGLSVAVFWGVYAWARHILPLKALVAAWAMSLILHGGVGIAQFARQSSVGLWSLGERWLRADGAGLSVIVADGRRWLRAYGLMPHPNILGGYLAMWTLVCIGAALATSPPGRRLERYALWGAIVIGSTGLFCTFSRSAWLGYAIGLGYLIACTPARERLRSWLHSPRHLFLIGVLLLALIALVIGLAGGVLASRLVHLSEPLERASLSERVIDVGLAWTLIRARPWLGVGPGYYEAALWAAIGNSQGDGFPGFRVVHNTPLLVAAELGIVGVALWLWLLLAPVLLRALRRPWHSEPFLSTGIAAAWLCAFVIGIFDYYLHLPVTWWPAMHLGLLAAAWARVITRDEEADA